MNAWHLVDDNWVAGDPPMLTAWSHASWMGSAIFDAARAFEGATPDLDLHCRRAVRSAAALGLRSPLTAGAIEEIIRDGISRFPVGTTLYMRAFLWAQEGVIAPDPKSTRIVISVVEWALPDPRGTSLCLSGFRRPPAEMAPTGAKAVALYAQGGRAANEAVQRGFDDAVMLDPLGNVAEFTVSNVWIGKDGAAHTPAPNGTFLNGITRQRVAKLLRRAGIAVHERSITYQEMLEADEIFSTGNFGKVMPMTRIETRELEPGPIYTRARELYWAFAHGG